MMAEQIVLPFRLMRRKPASKPQTGNHDLVGLSYYDGASDVVVTDICPSNVKLVVVTRESDGKGWTVPAGLIRLILGNKKKRRRIA